MLKSIVFLVILSFTVNLTTAQIQVHSEGTQSDTLRVVFYEDNWAIEHTVKLGETVFMLAKKYHVPPAMLADVNKVTYSTGFKEGQLLYVPLGAYNQVKKNNTGRTDLRPLNYIVTESDNLFRLAHMAGVKQRTLQSWNGMSDNYIEPGQSLFVGWVLHDMLSKPFASSNNEDVNEVDDEEDDVIAKPKQLYDTFTKVVDGQTVIVLKKRDSLTKTERKYVTQTNNEQNMVEESGTATFYEMKGKVSANKEYFYAFHNQAKVGTIIKVHNPGTDKTVFVKVLGTIPETKQYHNSVIGISSGAKKELMVVEDKAWCELRYAPATN